MSAVPDRTVPAPGGRRLVRAAAIAAAAFVVGFLAVPRLEILGGPVGAALRAAYHPLCHQLPSRCLDLDGRPWAVCARCAGLYLGGAAALAIAAFSRRAARLAPRPAWLLVAALPTALDAALATLAGAGVPNLPRLILALPAGFVAGLFLAEGLADLGGRRWTTAPRTCSDRR